MDTRLLYIINETLDFSSIAISTIILISFFLRKKDMDTPSKYFALSNGTSILFAMSDFAMCYFDIHQSKYSLYYLMASSFALYFFGIFLFLFFIGYEISYYNRIDKVEKVDKKYWILAALLVLLYLILLCVTPITGFFYTFTEEQHYIRGKFYLVSILIQIVLYAEALFLVLKYHKRVSKHQNLAFASFIFIPFIGQVIQTFNYGVTLNSFCVMLSFMIIYINIIQELEERIEKQNVDISEKEKSLINLQHQTILSLSNLVENRDTDTGEHVRRTSAYVKALAIACKKEGLYPEIINESFIYSIEQAAPLHDIGKIVVPDFILKKPGKLTVDEFEQMQRHAKEGGRIIREVLGIGHDKEYVKLACEIATSHHEKWNGKGYPYHLNKENIPLSARIMAIADVFDALVSPRCYKQPMPYDDAFKIIKDEAGQHFDPTLVNIFLNIKSEVIDISDKYKDTQYNY